MPYFQPSIKVYGVTFLLATAVGVIAANLYYAQPILALIGKSLGLAPSLSGFIVMLSQIGYGLGVLLIVPLGDLIENRRLILTMMSLGMVSLLGLGFTTTLIPYLVAAFLMGACVSTAQVLVSYAAHFSSEANRGRAVGTLMSGLMVGIMMSRPLSSFLTDLFSWHAVFYVSAALMAALAIALYIMLPERTPQALNIKYGQLIISMGHLFVRTPILRRRAIYQGFMFGAFSLFWTAIPLYLAGPEFRFSQSAIGGFALAGVAGAIVAPWVGKLADLGFSRFMTAIAMGVVAFSFFLARLLEPGSVISLSILFFCALLIDAGITANLILGQKAIFSLPAKYRGRLNGLYVATIFVGGAIGSWLGAWAYAHGGWMLTSLIGLTFPTCAMIFFGSEWLTGFSRTGYRRRKAAPTVPTGIN